MLVFNDLNRCAKPISSPAKDRIFNTANFLKILPTDIFIFTEVTNPLRSLSIYFDPFLIATAYFESKIQKIIHKI